jgi:hypothetical protein
MKQHAIEESPKSLICFSHLRWDFVYQRPQHLLSRFANDLNVYFFEEPVFGNTEEEYLSISKRGEKLYVIVPQLKHGMEQSMINTVLSSLLDNFLLSVVMEECTFWYYTPMALTFTDKYKPKLIVYDCMDELSAFAFAPPEMVMLEKKLMAKSDVVFTGGHSLYEAKKQQHANIMPYPSSIEKEHFAKARVSNIEASDQRDIKGPKIGFYGVIDERFDIDLIRTLAEERPDWQIILIGPVVKIDQNLLPRNKNIHYLGQRSYSALPEYLAGWDVAMIPFLLNESTRFISPTKTPEYLAAGIPVVSSPIRDVVKPYGIKKLVHICSTYEEFIQAIELELKKECSKDWLREVDQFLLNISWDETYKSMSKQITASLNNTTKISIAS